MSHSRRETIKRAMIMFGSVGIGIWLGLIPSLSGWHMILACVGFSTTWSIGVQYVMNPWVNETKER